MEKSSYVYRGYISYSGRPSLPFEPNETDNDIMRRTTAEFSHLPSFTVERNSTLSPVQDDRRWHRQTSTVYGGPVEELISKIMDDVNLHSTITPSNAGVTVAGQPHDSAGNDIDRSKIPSSGSWARPTRPTWAAANPGIGVKLGEPAMDRGKPAPTFLGNPSAWGDHYNQDEKKPVLSIRHDNYDDYSSKSGQLANKPSVQNSGGSIWPNHVKPSSFKVRASPTMEPTNNTFKLMDPKKEVTKPVSLSTSPSTGLYGATTRGEFLNRKEQGKGVAHVTPQYHSYNNVNLSNDSGKKPAQNILGGYPKPSHVMEEATLPISSRVQLGESPKYRGGSLEPPKEYGKPASVTAALPMNHNNASGHSGTQSNPDVRKATLPSGDGSRGISPPVNDNGGKLKEAAKPTAITSAHPTSRNGLEEHKPIRNSSWGDNSTDSERQNIRHGPLAPISITNNGDQWPRQNPPRAVSLSPTPTGSQIGEPVNVSKAVEPLNEAAKPTHRPAASPEPKYNPIPSPVQKKESSEKTMDKAPRRYGNLDPSSQHHLQTAETNKGSVDGREAARKYRGMELGNI